MKAALITMYLGLGGCSMMAGLGEDMQRAGVNLQQRAYAGSPANPLPADDSERSYDIPETIYPPPGGSSDLTQ